MSEPAMPLPNEKLVRVFDTEQESEAMVVKALLDSAGIDAQFGDSENSPDVLPVGGVGILVRESDAERARQILESGFDESAMESTGEEDPER